MIKKKWESLFLKLKNGSIVDSRIVIVEAEDETDAINQLQKHRAADETHITVPTESKAT